MPGPQIATVKLWVCPPRSDAFILRTQRRVLITGQYIIDHNNGTMVQPQQNIAKIPIGLVIGMEAVNEHQVIFFRTQVPGKELVACHLMHMTTISGHLLNIKQEGRVDTIHVVQLQRPERRSRLHTDF